MCDTKGHQHWCSGCGKNLNKVPKDSYTEIEWNQNDKGQIVAEKSMICKECLEESENIRELDKFFSELRYSPWSHIFCSNCKKDLTEELGKDIRPGVDYECLNFKCHERSGPNIKHIIKVVVLCKNCVKSEFNAENLTKLKRLGKNPLFKPMVTCPNTEICKQFQEGDEKVNCKNIVIGRDRETLQFGLLCGRKHKGCQLLPFDDGFAITRPRKGKGAAMANPSMFPTVQGLNPVQDYFKEIEKLFKKYKIGKFAEPTIDDNRLLAIETRMTNMERALGINGGTKVSCTPLEVCNVQGESSGCPNSIIACYSPARIWKTQEKQENKKQEKKEQENKEQI